MPAPACACMSACVCAGVCACLPLREHVCSAGAPQAPQPGVRTPARTQAQAHPHPAGPGDPHEPPQSRLARISTSGINDPGHAAGSGGLQRASPSEPRVINQRRTSTSGGPAASTTRPSISGAVGRAGSKWEGARRGNMDEVASSRGSSRSSSRGQLQMPVGPVPVEGPVGALPSGWNT